MEEKSGIAAWMGLDWGDQRHVISLQAEGSEQIETDRLEQKAEAIDRWLSALRLRWGGRPVAVALEQSRGPLIYALMHTDFLVLYPINPKALARYREVFGASGAKDDPGDAWLLRDLVQRHHRELTPWRPEEASTRALRLLVEQRRKLVDEQTRLTNRLGSLLKEYFPQVLEWFPDLAHRQCLQLLHRWPSLQALQRARRATLQAFWRQGRGGAKRADEKIRSIRQAVALTRDPALLAVHPLVARILAGQLLTLHEGIVGLERAIEARMADHPEAPVFQSFPGAGPALAPRLLVAFGTDRDRFDARHMQCFSGIAPVTQQSGKSRWVHHRWSCPKFLKQTFHEFARCSIPHCPWAHAYYRLQREHGHGHHAAIRRLAYTWIRILTRCWKTGTPYSEQTCLNALRAAHSPLIQRLEEATAA